jgi:hypothetical protein
VSKAWRAQAIEFLFESLHLRLRPLTYSLDIPRSLKGPKSPLFRYLFVGYYDSHQEKSALRAYKPLISALPRMVGLISLALRVLGSPPSLLGAVLPECNRSLRQLELNSFKLSPDFANIISAFVPQLEHLLRSYVQAPTGIDANMPSRIARMPSLHTLIFRSTHPRYFRYITWDPPKLELLAIEEELVRESFSSVLRLFPIHVKLLRCSGELSIREVLQRFSKLEVLHCFIPEPATWRRVNASGPFPALREVALAFYMSRTTTIGNVLLAAFTSLSNRNVFPSIERIRIDHFDPEFFSDEEWWPGMSKILCGLEIRVEGPQGLFCPSRGLIDHDKDNATSAPSQ